MTNPAIESLFEGGKTHVEFKKDEEFTGTISRDVYEELYQRGCIEVNGLPPMDLNNNIHPVFRREAFTDISDDEYERIRPTVTLASRFITEDEYMRFWTHLCTGRSVDDDRPGKNSMKDWRVQVIEKTKIDSKEAIQQTRQALLDVANNLTFFILDEDWCMKDHLRVAEAFSDPDQRKCRRNNDFTETGCESGECARCDGDSKDRCYVCQISFDAMKPMLELTGMVQDRWMPHAYEMQNPNHATEEDTLIAALENMNEVQEADRVVPPFVYKMTNEQLSNLQVGLNWDVLKHIRKGLSDEIWSESEEIRFQMAVAATLCHELVHIFWWWAQRRCVRCEQADPWWSKSEDTSEKEPELGISWEYWAFGSRVPCSGKLHESAGQALPNIFQRSQWNWVNSTEQGGQGRHVAVIHDFIFPVVYINSWFQESTWESIRQLGRKAGRPRHDNMVIMRNFATDLMNENVLGNHECTIELYSHTELVANGGFNGGGREFLYGASGLATGADTEAHISKLRRDLKQRLQKARRLQRAKTAKQRTPTKGGTRKRGAVQVTQNVYELRKSVRGRVTK